MTFYFGIISFTQSIEYRTKIVDGFLQNQTKKIKTHRQHSLWHDFLIIDENDKKQSIICREIKTETATSFILQTDEFGFSPIYYLLKNDTLFFSSAQRYLLPFLDSPTLNQSVFCELFKLGFIVPPDTLIKDIYSVLSSKTMCFDGTISFKEREKDTSERAVHFSENDLCDHLASSLQEIIGQNNIGLLFSGGLDSSLIARVLNEELDQSLSLFTLLPNCGHEILQQAITLNPNKNATHYYKPQKDDFWRGVYSSIFHGESEVVGALSLNAAVEYLFAEYIAQQAMDVVLTGDDNWIVPQNILSQPPGYYALKYGILADDRVLNRFLHNNKSSYLYYCHKYQPILRGSHDPAVLKRNRAEVHATLIGKINGKIRMNLPNSPAYYFPLLNSYYRNYISSLNEQYSDFNYRNTLKSLLERKRMIKKEQMDKPKLWMPSFFDGDDSHDISRLIMEKITQHDHVVNELFGKENIQYAINQCAPLPKIKLLMTLLYLIVFHDIFIVNKGRQIETSTMFPAYLVAT